VSYVPPRQQADVRRILATQLPGVAVTDLEGATRPGGGEDPVRFHVPGGSSYGFGYSGLVQSGVLVGTDSLALAHLSGAQLTRAREVLQRGGAVVLTNGPVGVSTVTVVAHGSHGRTRLEVPAVYVDVGASQPAPVMGVLSSRLAGRLGLDVRLAGMYLHGSSISTAQQGDLTQAFGALSPRIQIYVEHGYQVTSSERIVLWILFGLAGVLMLGGTLTATFLALSDARPDLATLSAVGASPRTRRAVAAGYAVSVGVVGAALGAAVGFIPGIAVTYPLTRSYTGAPGPSHYLSIPWLEIVGLVVALPILTALIVGLLARSRLPLVARLD
jgi:putative ABC transport system permease protein